jgi:hypothetical protein
MTQSALFTPSRAEGNDLLTANHVNGGQLH